MKNVLIDPVTKKFVSIKSERGQEILRMQAEAAATKIIDACEEEEEVYVAPEEEVEVQTDSYTYADEESAFDRVKREQAEQEVKYADVQGFADVAFIKQRIESGLFKVMNTDRQTKNGTLSLEVQMTPESKVEHFVLYKSTGHIVRNGKTFIHRGYKDCGNIAETCDAFEAYWTRREAKHLKSLETAK